MSLDDSVRVATELLVRDLGREAAEAELQARATNSDDPMAERALAALAAIRNGEVAADG